MVQTQLNGMINVSEASKFLTLYCRCVTLRHTELFGNWIESCDTTVIEKTALFLRFAHAMKVLKILRSHLLNFKETVVA